ncbi:hypothetical protein [Shewanella sp. NFH-SH190041]|nr:hypothetical protein [Shewanella sp. NFH-SH190041]
MKLYQKLGFQPVVGKASPYARFAAIFKWPWYYPKVNSPLVGSSG